jgi:type II secretion system protein H
MSRNEHGFSLLELLIVVTILGIAASVAIPDISTTTPNKIELAAEEFAEAMRFARSEAMRTGQPHGFRQRSINKRIRVFRADTGTSPWSLIYDVYHPLSKQLYDIDLDSHAFASANSTTRTTAFIGTCDERRNIYFDGNGTARCMDPETVLLEEFTVTLTLDKHTRIVTLKGITGRVIIQ